MRRSVAGLVAVLMSTGASTGLAAGSVPGTVTATVTSDVVGRVPFRFLGLSLEIRGVENYAGFNPHAVDPVFEQLIRNLNPGQRPSIRLAGDTADWTWAPIAGVRRPLGVRYALTPTWFAVVRALAEDVDARLIVGVNLEVDRLRVAAAEARAIAAGIGSPWLQALELGNEPELYNVLPWFVVNHVPVYGRGASWGFSDFLGDYAAIARALPALPLAGPDAGSPAWVDGLGTFLSSEPRVRIATVHRYSVGCLPATAPTIAGLLSPASTQGLAAGLGPALATAHAHGIPLRVDEMNTISCGGQAGVSDTFAAALWSLDVSFELAEAGVDGLNIHSRVGLANQLFSFRRVDGVWQGHVAPEYYGLLAFARAAPAGSELDRVAGVPAGRLQVWATHAPDGTERVVLINLASRTPATVTVRAGSRGGAASLERLRAPGVGATAGLTLGGQSFGRQTTTGRPVGAPRTIPVRRLPRGAYRVPLPAASAAILTLR